MDWRKARISQAKQQQRAFVHKKDNPFALYSHDPNSSETFLDVLSSQNRAPKVAGIIPVSDIRSVRQEQSFHGTPWNSSRSVSRGGGRTFRGNVRGARLSYTSQHGTTHALAPPSSYNETAPHFGPPRFSQPFFSSSCSLDPRIQQQDRARPREYATLQQQHSQRSPYHHPLPASNGQMQHCHNGNGGWSQQQHQSGAYHHYPTQSSTFFPQPTQHGVGYSHGPPPHHYLPPQNQQQHHGAVYQVHNPQELGYPQHTPQHSFPLPQDAQYPAYQPPVNDPAYQARRHFYEEQQANESFLHRQPIWDDAPFSQEEQQYVSLSYDVPTHGQADFSQQQVQGLSQHDESFAQAAQATTQQSVAQRYGVSEDDVADAFF
jgi:hypothetical protein